MAVRRNVTGDPAFHYCAWCANSGWVYLRRFTVRKRTRVAHTFPGQVERWQKAHNVTFPLNAERKAELREMQKSALVDDRYPEQVLAPCIVCERGERQHRRCPSLPTDYAAADIDVTLEDHQLGGLSDQARAAYLKARADTGMTVRAQELAMTRDERDVLEYSARLDTGPGPVYDGG